MLAMIDCLPSLRQKWGGNYYHLVLEEKYSCLVSQALLNLKKVT